MKIRVLVSGLVLAALTGPAFAEDLAPQIDQVFSAYGKDTPGCALAVVRDGGIVYSRGYGMAGTSTATAIPATSCCRWSCRGRAARRCATSPRSASSRRSA